MDNTANRLRMIFIVIGFLFIVAVIFIVNRLMAQGISESEKQIKYFQSQSGVKQGQLRTLSTKSDASQKIQESTYEETAQPVKTTAGQPEIKDNIIYEPPLDSAILVQ